MVGLKPSYGGSIPSFLGRGVGFVQMRALQMCGREEGIREVTLHLLWLVLLIGLHV